MAKLRLRFFCFRSSQRGQNRVVYFMIHLIPYKKTQIQVSTEIAGLKLLPFSLGHCYLLSSLDSPFVKGGLINEEDIYLVRFVLSRPYFKALQDIGSEQYAALKMLEVAEFWDDIFKNMAKYVELINSHIGWYSTAPLRNDLMNAGKTKTLKCPWQVYLAVSLSSALSTPIKEVWEMSLNECFAYKAALDIKEGRDEDLMDAKDVETREMIESVKAAQGLDKND